MAEPAAGITRANAFGEREPPASRSKKKGKARATVTPSFVTLDLPSPDDAIDAEEDEKHELDTMA
jgi:hypothetical protein